ncbi:MAG: ribonuclease PH [Acidobacteriota bacterium]
MNRPDSRAAEDLRPVEILPDHLKHPQGSVLIRMGETHVLCAATVEDRTPPFLKDSGHGWVTAEYAMLPAATGERTQREVSRGRVSGRSSEIQRLIGRCLRGAVDLKALGERTVWVDCDVIQADGGTRTASITGAFVALALALHRLHERGKLKNPPLISQVAAVSAGVVAGEPLVDLCYQEDAAADTDMNIVMNDAGEFIEVQGTAEKDPFSRATLDRLLELAADGIGKLQTLQAEVLGERLNSLRAPHLGD